MNLDDARTCKKCQSGDDVKLKQPLRDGLMFHCTRCKRIWTVIFGRESQPMFPPSPEA
jgi:predicted  nucleic acid-binding Zn ribbon protein